MGVRVCSASKLHILHIPLANQSDTACSSFLTPGCEAHEHPHTYTTYTHTHTHAHTHTQVSTHVRVNTQRRRFYDHHELVLLDAQGVPRICCPNISESDIHTFHRVSLAHDI